MPQTEIRVFRDGRGRVPLLEWLDDLEAREPRAYVKCLERILALESLGHELRRPRADYLRDGVYELRCRIGRVNYRMLYFFHGSHSAVMSHGFTKEGDIPDSEIDRAVAHKRLVERDSDKHTAEWSI
ncbi:MAG: type II toxin-antitoxin system RelE/ParE family toxin [Planctomycetota bacterium]|nr:MAG: type II toxin-antitoxin system RelE/ParE family toxin [Planctomycetota bacterium]